MKSLAALVLGALFIQSECTKPKGGLRFKGIESKASSKSVAEAEATGPNAFAWTNAIGFAWSGNEQFTGFPGNKNPALNIAPPGNKGKGAGDNNLVVGENNDIAGSGNAVFGNNNKISGGSCFKC